MSRGGVISLKFSLAKAAAATPPRFAKDSGVSAQRESPLRRHGAVCYSSFPFRGESSSVG